MNAHYIPALSRYIANGLPFQGATTLIRAGAETSLLSTSTCLVLL